MKIYGHRGYSAVYPENTMLAFRKAIEYGADGIETDVHLTKDGVLVICHDESIDRTSDGKGWIRDYTYEQLQQFNFKFNKQVDEFVPMPKLEELLKLAKESGILLNIEIKTDHYQYAGIEQKTYDLVREYGLLDHTMFSSFHLESLIELRRIDPEVKVGYLFEVSNDEDPIFTFNDKLLAAKRNGIYQIHPEYVFLDQKTLEKMIRHHIEVNAWTINKEKDIRFFNVHGLDGCITNYVELGVKIKNETR